MFASGDHHWSKFMGSSSPASLSASSVTGVGLEQPDLLDALKQLKRHSVKCETFWYGVYKLGSAVTSAAASIVNMKNEHHFVVFEYGPSIQEDATGFTHESYIRIDFHAAGYDYNDGETMKYWDTYKKEMEEYTPKLIPCGKCEGTMQHLLDMVSKHSSKYNVMNNNCQDFAAKLYEIMTPTDNMSYEDWEKTILWNEMEQMIAK